MVVPLISRTKGDLGSLVIVRSAKVSNTEKELLQHIAETFSHALDSFLSQGSILSFFGRIFSGWLMLDFTHNMCGEVKGKTMVNQPYKVV